jgi:hypothetical protein
MRQEMTKQSSKRARVALLLGVVAILAGLLSFSVFNARSDIFSRAVRDSKLQGWSAFGDLEGALSGAMEPIGGLGLRSERREVLADDSVGGAPVRVTVLLGGLPRAIYPDINGVFPSVEVKAHQRVQVNVSYPEGIAGEAVQVQTQDGGTLDEDSSARIVSLNESGEFSFWFEASGNEGTHRVTVRRGFDEKTFDFWVGTKPAMHVVRSSGVKVGH